MTNNSIYQIVRSPMRLSEMLVTGSVEYSRAGWTQAKLEACIEREINAIEAAGHDMPAGVRKFFAAAKYVTGRGYVGHISRKSALDALSSAKCHIFNA